MESTWREGSDNANFWLEARLKVIYIYTLCLLGEKIHNLVLMFDAVPFIILLKVRRSRVFDVQLPGEDVRNVCGRYK